MHKSRLEAFSDGVIAIIITIMILELHIPAGGEFNALIPLLPKFLVYVLSFIYIAIYWNNHHHLFQAVKEVNGSILWANMHLLFWLSLVPFATGWMGEHSSETAPVLLYGIILWMAGLAYYILVRRLIAHHGKNSLIAKAIGKDNKGMLSLYIYSAAIIASFFFVWISLGLYIIVAVMWLIPDRRIEDNLKKS